MFLSSCVTLFPLFLFLFYLTFLLFLFLVSSSVAPFLCNRKSLSFVFFSRIMFIIFVLSPTCSSLYVTFFSLCFFNSLHLPLIGYQFTVSLLCSLVSSSMILLFLSCCYSFRLCLPFYLTYSLVSFSLAILFVFLYQLIIYIYLFTVLSVSLSVSLLNLPLSRLFLRSSLFVFISTLLLSLFRAFSSP